MPDEKLSFVIAGLGSIGQRHLKNLVVLGVQNITLFRTGKGLLNDPALHKFPVYYDLEKALLTHPDAVVVSNPTALHMETALAAVKEGCHLFLEKPISHNYDGIEELSRVVGQLGLTVQVGFQFRYHPLLKQIKYWLEEDRIGRVISAHAHWGEYLPDWHPWEDYRKSYSARRDMGGGVLLTLCHPFDYLRWLIGEVTSVSAMTGNLSGLGLETEDTAQVNLRFQNNAVGSVHLDYIQRPPQHMLTIIGENGMMAWDNSKGYAALHVAGNRDAEHVQEPDGFERNVLFQDQIAEFITCLTERIPPGCTLKDGVRALGIVLAAKRSAEERREIDVEYPL